MEQRIAVGTPVQHQRHGWGQVEELHEQSGMALVRFEHAYEYDGALANVPVGELTPLHREQARVALNLAHGLPLEQEGARLLILMGAFGPQGHAGVDEREWARDVLLHALYPTA